MEDNSNRNDDETIKPAVNTQVQQIVAEKAELDGYNFPIANKLLDGELQKVLETQKPNHDRRYIDLLHNRRIMLSAKVLLPSAEFPHINYVGKLLGFKGETLKHLQEITNCRMFILGKGSMNREKEEMLVKSGNPKYAHLTDVLHIEVTCLAPATEAYSRMSHALTTLRKYLQPDPNPPGIAVQEEEVPNFQPCENRNVVNFVEKARQSMEFQPVIRPFRKAMRSRGYQQRGPGHQSHRAPPYHRREPQQQQQYDQQTSDANIYE